MMELQEFNKSSLKQLERSDNDIKFWILWLQRPHLLLQWLYISQ